MSFRFYAIDVMDFKLPFKIDPSKIKNRWSLGALLMIVWLFIAYLCLSDPDQDKGIILAILFLTILAIFIILSITANPVPVKTSSEKEAPERAHFYARVVTQKDIQIVGSAEEIREILGDLIMDRRYEK